MGSLENATGTAPIGPQPSSPSDENTRVPRIIFHRPEILIAQRRGAVPYAGTVVPAVQVGAGPHAGRRCVVEIAGAAGFGDVDARAAPSGARGGEGHPQAQRVGHERLPHVHVRRAEVERDRSL